MSTALVRWLPGRSSIEIRNFVFELTSRFYVPPNSARMLLPIPTCFGHLLIDLQSGTREWVQDAQFMSRSIAIELLLEALVTCLTNQVILMFFRITKLSFVID